MEQQILEWPAERRILTVSDLSASVRELLNREFGNVWVAGEISGLKLASSGHAYFTMKDAGAQLRCACFRGSLRLLRFQPQEGMAVLARGRIDVYEPRGDYQLIVEVLEPQGFGALQLAFEQLKKKLEAEGLFAAERKKPLPRFPRRIGIVTSQDGAALRDMLHVLERRFPGLHVRLYPAQVQGAGSMEAVVAGIEHFASSGWAEVVIAGRGGGSLEDLWTFNLEEVARVIAACPVPVVSAVGHETDFTIADFVADLRAPTPSAAAELVVPEREDVLRGVAALRERLARALHFRALRQTQRLDELDYRGRAALLSGLDGMRRVWQECTLRLQRRDPMFRLAAAHRRLDRAAAALGELTQRRLATAKARLSEATGALSEEMPRRTAATRRRLEVLRAALEPLSPFRVLERGYAIVQGPSGHPLRASAGVGPGDRLDIRLARGRLRARVDEAEN